MSGTGGPGRLERLLGVDPADGGCDHARELLHVYAELVLRGDESAGARYPEIAAHVVACGPCGQDLEGLLLLLREQDRGSAGSGSG
jgi:hypothetical protein